MKRAFQRTMKKLTRTSFAARADALHAESRAEVAKMCAEGRGWEGLRRNVARLGIKSDSGDRPKLVFGARR